MGVRLIAELIHHGPRDIPDAEWRVLVVLCESARDATRKCWPGAGEIEEVTGKAESTVRRLLTNLERRKLIKRLDARQIQPGAAPVVAYRGWRTVFEIMSLTETQGLTSGPLPDEKGARSEPERGPVPRSKGPRSGPPSPHVPASPLTAPVEISPAVVAEVRAALLERSGRDVGDEWALLVAQNELSGRRGITHPRSWIRAVIERETNVQRFLPVPRA